MIDGGETPRRLPLRKTEQSTLILCTECFTAAMHSGHLEVFLRRRKKPFLSHAEGRTSVFGTAGRIAWCMKVRLLEQDTDDTQTIGTGRDRQTPAGTGRDTRPVILLKTMCHSLDQRGNLRHKMDPLWEDLTCMFMSSGSIDPGCHV